MKTDKAILICGGAGYIGAHVTRALVQAGYSTVVIDDLSTGSLNNIKHLKENPEFRDRFFVTVDTILNEEKMSELIGSSGMVMHLAAAVGVKTILDDPLVN